MLDLDMKKKVAQEIMDLMDVKDGEKLKKHPKLVAASIEVEKKPGLEALKSEDEPSPESELMEKKEDSSEPELDEETIKKLLEMVSGK